MGILSDSQRTLIYIGEVACFLLSLGVTWVLSELGLANRLFATPKLALAYVFYFVAMLFLGWGRLLDEALYCSRMGLGGKLARAMLVDLLIAFWFFYYLPVFGPVRSRAFLVYIGTLIVFTLVWRGAVLFVLGFWEKRRAVLVAPVGDDAKALFSDTNTDPAYPLVFAAFVVDDPAEAEEHFYPSMVLREALADGVDLIVLDIKQRTRMDFYSKLFPGICFADYGDVFEMFYGRKPGMAKQHRE